MCHRVEMNDMSKKLEKGPCPPSFWLQELQLSERPWPAWWWTVINIPPEFVQEFSFPFLRKLPKSLAISQWLIIKNFQDPLSSGHQTRYIIFQGYMLKASGSIGWISFVLSSRFWRGPHTWCSFYCQQKKRQENKIHFFGVSGTSSPSCWWSCSRAWETTSCFASSQTSSDLSPPPAHCWIFCKTKWEIFFEHFMKISSSKKPLLCRSWFESHTLTFWHTFSLCLDTIELENICVRLDNL